jgi:hypothetical protein
MADQIIEAAEEIEAELFPPKPGGLVDRHRQRKAAQRAAADLAEQEQVPVEGPSYRAVKVAPESPEGLSAITYTIAEGGSAMILPNSPYRYRATVLVVTAVSTVILAKDSGGALGQNGFVLPAGLPLPLYSRAQLWAYNNSGQAVQVSVIAELYAPEQHAAPAAARTPETHHRRAG